MPRVTVSVARQRTFTVISLLWYLYLFSNTMYWFLDKAVSRSDITQIILLVLQSGHLALFRRTPSRQRKKAILSDLFLKCNAYLSCDVRNVWYPKKKVFGTLKLCF